MARWLDRPAQRRRGRRDRRRLGSQVGPVGRELGSAYCVAEGGPQEVSPVLKGAGVNTRTRYVKSADTLDEEIQLAVEAVEKAVARAERVEALRAEKGLEMTGAIRKSLEGLDAATKSLHELLSKHDIDKSELERMYAQFALKF